MEFDLWVILTLFVAAFVAGFLDTLVGGGGLITIPALLMAGLSPVQALGTNKLQAVMGSGTASMHMFKRKIVRFESVRVLMALAFIGSIIGTVSVQYISTQALEIVIPAVVILIAVYFVLAPNQADFLGEAKMSERSYATSVVPGIGFYDGMFGPGTGSFFVLAGVSLRGQKIVSATAIAKTLNFATNFGALLIFMVYGQLVWLVGLFMMVGQFLGASLGARTLLKINPQLLRFLVIAMCLVMLVSWAFSQR